MCVGGDACQGVCASAEAEWHRTSSSFGCETHSACSQREEKQCARYTSQHKCSSATPPVRWTVGGNGLCGFHPHPGMGMTSDGTARPSEGPAHFMLLCQGRRKRSFLVSGAEALSRGLCESRPGNSRWRRGRERTTPSGSWRVSKLEFLRAGQEAADRPLGGRGRGVRPAAVAVAPRCMPPIATTAGPRSPPTGTASPAGRAHMSVRDTPTGPRGPRSRSGDADPAGCPCRSPRTTSDS